jgi:hypothetical protein
MPFRLKVSGIVLAGAAAATVLPAAAAPSLANRMAADGARGPTLLQPVDARSYHHCHNMPRRIRCHKSERLPVNWPPHTSTPESSSLRDWHASKAGACTGGRRGCLGRR